MLRLPTEDGGSQTLGLTLEGLFELHAVASALLRQAGHRAEPARFVSQAKAPFDEPRLKQRGAFP